MFKVKCLKCGKVLESKYRHDFRQCNCENQTFVDGGGEYYSRYGGVDMDLVKVVKEESEEEPIPACQGGELEDNFYCKVCGHSYYNCLCCHCE